MGEFLSGMLVGCILLAILINTPWGVANSKPHYKENVCTYLNGEWINNSDGPNFCLIDGRRVDIKEKK